MHKEANLSCGFGEDNGVLLKTKYSTNGSFKTLIRGQVASLISLSLLAYAVLLLSVVEALVFSPYATRFRCELAAGVPHDYFTLKPCQGRYRRGLLRLTHTQRQSDLALIVGKVVMTFSSRGGGVPERCSV